jgi:GPI ethanolamine phosphate transferase 2/3 subunit F
MQSSTQIQLCYGTITAIVHILLISYEMYSEKYLKIEKFWSSKVLHAYFLIELLKYAYLRKIFSLENAVRETTLFKNKKTIQYSTKQKLKETVKSLVFIFIATVFYSFVCIILGAPALDGHNETFSLSMLLTIFTLLPFILFVGVEGTMNTLFSEVTDVQSNLTNAYLSMLKNNAIAVIVGAWSGSIMGEF